MIWINVKDKPVPEGETVLAVCGVDVIVGEMEDDFFACSPFTRYIPGEQISHWQALPELPEIGT